MTTRAQTAQHKKAFLDAFAEYGNVSRAATVASVDRRTIYKWLEHDEHFTLEYRQAEMQAEDVLEHAGWKRAVNGVEQEHGVYHQGEQIATEVKTEYSDTLLMFLLKARNPKKYRDRVSIDYGDVPTDKLLAEAVALGLVTAGDRPA